MYLFLFLVAFTELARCFLYLRDCDSLGRPTYMKLGRFVNTIRDTTFTFLVWLASLDFSLSHFQWTTKQWQWRRGGGVGCAEASYSETNESVTKTYTLRTLFHKHISNTETHIYSTHTCRRYLWERNLVTQRAPYYLVRLLYTVFVDEYIVNICCFVSFMSYTYQYVWTVYMYVHTYGMTIHIRS